MNGTITISVPEKTRNAFAAASPYQREAALRRFAETLETPEPELIQEQEAFDGDVPDEMTFEAHWKRMDNSRAMTYTLEDVDRIAETRRAETKAHAEEIGFEAFAEELDALESNNYEDGKH